MTPYAPLSIRTRLRTRILLLTGGVVVLLMFVISFFLLVQWREIIIRKESDNAAAVSKTFAVSVLDAMILEETSGYRREYVLESYAQNFLTGLGNVSYIEITDRSGTSLLRTTAEPAMDSAALFHEHIVPPGSRDITIYENRYCGWTLEVTQPLLVSRTYWGTVRIGFDARPIRTEIAAVFYLLFISTVTVTGVVLLILSLSIHRMTASIERLMRAVDSIDLTSDPVTEQVQQHDEIGYFYRHFSLLQERLESSRKQLEQTQQQLYHAEKLASIGRLAAGVAHQVNNPLNGIKSCLYALQRNPDDSVKAKEYLGLINEGIENIETVVKKLLGFARREATSDQVIDLHAAIRKVIALFELRLKEKEIDVFLDLPEEPVFVRIEDHLFQEVVLNLVLNSADAIDQRGTITIRTDQVPDGTIVMTIHDTGGGIAAEDLPKIFDPFFTTKAVGTGTGLGLSVCMGIIESHGGHISVRSAPDSGTVFTITLPPYHEEETADHRG